MVFGVQHLVLDAPALQHFAQQLGFFNGNGAHQHGLALFVALDNILDHRLELSLFRAENAVRQVLADHGPVGGNLHHVQLVDLPELLLLGHGGTGHAGKPLVEAEVILEGDGGQGLGLPGYGDALLGLDCLVQTLVIPAAVHQAAGELVHDDDLAVLHHVLDIPLHHAVGLDGLVDVVLDGDVVRIGQVVDIKVGLRLLDARGGQGGGFRLFVHDIVRVLVKLVVVLFFVQLRHPGFLQGAGEPVGEGVKLGGFVPLAGNDQRRPSLVDENGVHLVHDGEHVLPLNLVFLIGDHIVPQVVEAQLVVGAVGDVGVIGFFPFLIVQIVDDQAYGQPQKTVQLAHPLRVAPGQIIVHRDDVNALPGQAVEVRRQGGHQGFAFTGFHFGDPALVEHDAADDLHREVTHPQHTGRGLAAYGERVGQDIIQGLAVRQPVLQHAGLSGKLFVGHILIGVFLHQHPVADRLDPL